MSLKERNLSSPLMWNAGVVPECLCHHRPLVVSCVSTLEEVTCVSRAPGPSAATMTCNNMITVIVSLLSLRKGLKI